MDDQWGTLEQAASAKGVTVAAVKVAVKSGSVESRVADGVTLVNVTEYLKKHRGRPKRTA